MNRLARPEAGEFNEYYAGYIAKVPDGDVVDLLDAQFPDTVRLLDSIPEEAETSGYAPGKWSPRQLVGHLIDSESMFANRILWIARSPQIELPGMDQDEWVENSNAGDRPLAVLTEDWAAVRAQTLRLARSVPDELLPQSGVASGHPVSIRGLLWIIAGHERHHRSALKRLYGFGGEGE